MSQSLVATGRGGTGKTTFVALAARFLDTPLLIDADPDQSLAAMLGLDLRDAGIKTISEVLHEVQKNREMEQIRSMPLAEKMEYLLHMDCLYEGDDFDLLSLGVKWTKGCYCQPNNLLRGLIPELAQNYAFTIVDSPAGLEHINRRVLDKVNHAFAVVDPSAKSMRNVERMRDIAREVGIRLEHVHMVANHDFPEGKEPALKKVEEADYVGKIAYDENVIEYDWDGKSLLELPADSPACTSVEKILETAGCSTVKEG